MQLLGGKPGGGGGGRSAPGNRAPAFDEGEYGAPADFGEPSGSASGSRPPDDDIPF
jgi:hypothetical protein